MNSLNSASIPYNANGGYSAGISTTPPDTTRVDGLSIRSSDLSLQPLTIRIPYCRTLKYNDSMYTDTGFPNNEVPLSVQSTLRLYATDRVDIFIAGDKDMEFYFQIGPPVDVLP